MQKDNIDKIRIKMESSLSEFQKRLRTSKNITIAGLGDSLTNGWMVSQGFFDGFIDKLKNALPETKIISHNKGIPGDTAQGGLERLDQILKIKPDLLTIQFGINDCFSYHNIGLYYEALEKIIKKTQKNGTVPVPVTSCPLSEMLEYAQVKPFYRAIREIGKDHEVKIADLEKYWLEKAGRGEVNMFLPDGVHPSENGHECMAQGLFEFIFNSS
jgi:acyl-CoA thioesterase I